eukprot:scaffold333637_cov17-Prasinocladus_malaysianus.AAC.1
MIDVTQHLQPPQVHRFGAGHLGNHQFIMSLWAIDIGLAGNCARMKKVHALMRFCNKRKYSETCMTLQCAYQQTAASTGAYTLFILTSMMASM